MPYRFYVICILFCLFSLAAFASNEPPRVPEISADLQARIQKLKSEKIYLDREWLLLGHYKQKLFDGYQSTVSGPQFFLSEDGSISPEKELEKTLVSFFSGTGDERTKFQCAYLARRDFILEKFSIPTSEVMPCPQYSEWISKLNPKAISLIYATGSFHESASSFGHVFLRLENPDRDVHEDLLNYGINYAARTQNVTGALYALYGLFGYFPGTYAMAPYHHLIKQYTNLEGRDLWEYRLSLSPNEIEHLVKHLLELERGSFDYYFLDDNCARMIAVALEVARPSLSISDRRAPWALPLDTIKAVANSNLISSTTFRRSLRTEFEDSYAPLSKNEKNQIKTLSVASAKPDSVAVTRKLASEMTNQALEAAQNFFALKGASEFQKYKEVNHTLAIERSKRPKSESRSAVTETKTSPEKGPKSSMVSGYLRQDGQTQLISGASVRAVGFDLLDSHVGSLDYSELALGELELESKARFETSLYRATLIHILSSYPVTELEKPFSWGFDLTWKKTWQADVRAGFSIDLNPKLRSLNFLKVKSQEATDDQTLLVPAAESLLSSVVDERTRFLLGIETHVEQNTLATDWLGGISWDATTNLQARLEKTLFNHGAKFSVRYSF